MTPSLETKIWLALKQRVDTLVLSPAIPVVFPGAVSMPANQPYLAVQNITNAPSRVLIQRGDHDRTGVFQIMLMQGLGQDYAVGREVAGDIAAHFPVDLVLRYRDVGVRVSSAPDVSDGFREGAYWQTPVRIPWQTYN